jgi:hypothetical protein
MAKVRRPRRTLPYEEPATVPTARRHAGYVIDIITASGASLTRQFARDGSRAGAGPTTNLPVEGAAHSLPGTWTRTRWAMSTSARASTSSSQPSSRPARSTETLP